MGMGQWGEHNRAQLQLVSYRDLSADRIVSVWNYFHQCGTGGSSGIRSGAWVVFSEIKRCGYFLSLIPMSGVAQPLTTKSHDASFALNPWDTNPEVVWSSELHVHYVKLWYGHCWVWNTENITMLERCGICCGFCVARDGSGLLPSVVGGDVLFCSSCAFSPTHAFRCHLLRLITVGHLGKKATVGDTVRVPCSSYQWLRRRCLSYR